MVKTSHYRAISRRCTVLEVCRVTRQESPLGLHLFVHGFAILVRDEVEKRLSDHRLTYRGTVDHPGGVDDEVKVVSYRVQRTPHSTARPVSSSADSSSNLLIR